MLDILRGIPRVAFRTLNKNCGQKKVNYSRKLPHSTVQNRLYEPSRLPAASIEIARLEICGRRHTAKSAPTWPDHPMSARGGIDQHAASTRQEGEPFTSHHKRGRCPLAFDRCDPAEICLSRHCESSATTATATRHSERIFSFGEFGRFAGPPCGSISHHASSAFLARLFVATSAETRASAQQRAVALTS